MRKQLRFFFPLKISADLVLLTVSFFVSSFLAKERIFPEQRFFDSETQEIILWLVLCAIWYFSSRATRLYDEFRSRTLSYELISVVKNCMTQLVASIVVIFIMKTIILSRYFIVAYCIFLLGLVGIWKIIFRGFLRWLMKKGYNLRRVLIAGAGEVGRRFAAMIESNPHLGYSVAGFLDDQDKPDLGGLYLGTIDDMEHVLNSTEVEEVIVALPNEAVERVNRVISASEKFPVEARIIPDYFRFFSPRFDVSIFGSFPLITPRLNPMEEIHWRILKRGFDLALACVLFVTVFFWLWPIIAIAIKLNSRGPVFFKQERWGRKNRRITCYKFRTMVKDSKDVDENGNYMQAGKNDRRITRVGRFLRRMSLDELPQFINVLKGEMSTVGPRPHPTPLNIESKDIIPQYMLRHLVKPGITGWAQVSGYRGETRDPALMKNRIAHDLWYIENWTFWLDIQIIFFTVRQIILGNSGAY